MVQNIHTKSGWSVDLAVYKISTKALKYHLHFILHLEEYLNSLTFGPNSSCCKSGGNKLPYNVSY